MYLALYRKFRPTTFDEVVGQDHIIKTLKNQIKNNLVGHAYLFCGSRGTGKTSVAKIFAKAVNCLNPKDGSPCKECEVCKQLSDVSNMDIIEIDAASNNRVDEIRDLRDKVKYAPMNGKFKVYIIDEVHMLTDSAFNALLKTLEEPPKHVIFILATTEPQKLPSTILSRVLRFDFRLVDTKTLKKLLKDIFLKSNIKAEDDAILEIAKSGNGSVRDCLSVADMCASYANGNITQKDVLEVLGASKKDVLLKLCEFVLKGQILDFVTLLNSEIQSGKNVVSISNEITRMLRDLFVLKSGGNGDLILNVEKDLTDQMKKIIESFNLKDLSFALQKFCEIEQELKFSTFPELLIETTAIKVGMEVCPDKFQNNLTKKNEKVENGSNPHKVWGQVLLNLSKDNLILHAMCAQLSDVLVENNDFEIIVENDNILEMLKKSENYAYLVDCFKNLGYNYSIKIIKKFEEKKQDKAKLLSEKIGLSVNKKE